MAEITIMTYTDFVCNKVIDSYSNKELIDKWNEYCVEKFDPNSQIYVNNTDFLDLFSKEDLVSNICYGEYSINDSYVTLDDYGDFKTSNYLDELLSKEKLADWIVRNSSLATAAAYIDYVQQNLYKLPLNKALQSYEAVADKSKYIEDDSTSLIEHAIETSLGTLVENSSDEEIKAAIKLNESEELVDLSSLHDYVNLDELLAPSHTIRPGFNPSDYWVVEFNRNYAERNLKDKPLTMELLNEIRSYVTTCYQNEETRKDVGFYFARIRRGETIDRINIDGGDPKQATYEVLDKLASRLSMSPRLAQAHLSSLADDLQAAAQAANRQQQQTASKHQTHNKKL